MATYSLVRSQVSTRSRPLPRPSATFSADLRLLHVGRDRRLVIGRIARALVRDADAAEPDRQPVAVGRLAGLADRHHDAAPIGVLAGDRRLDQRRIGDRHARCAAPSASIPRRRPMISTSLRAPSPSRATCSARLASTLCSALRKAVSRGSAGARDARRAARAAAPVANSQQRVGGRGVAVDGHCVEGVGDAPPTAAPAAPARAIGASVNTNDSMVAMSGAIMPAPLAMPLIVTAALPSSRRRGRDLWGRCRWS